MVEAIIEIRFLAVMIAVAALISMAAISVARVGAERAARTGELTDNQWALIETAGLCDAAGGQWTPPRGISAALAPDPAPHFRPIGTKPMEAPIIVLRTSVLFLVAFLLVVWQYVSHTTRLAADAAAQSAVAAAATEVPDDWDCDPDHPDLLGEGQNQAYRAVLARLGQGGVKAKSVTVTAEGCNVIATVTVGGLSARWPGT